MNWRVAAFLTVAGVAFCVSIVVFEFRYVWYIHPSESMALRGGYALCALAIIALWAFLPSRGLVFLVAAAALLFPHAFFAEDSRPLAGRAIDLATLGVVLGSALLFALATHLRRRCFKPRQE